MPKSERFPVKGGPVRGLLSKGGKKMAPEGGVFWGGGEAPLEIIDLRTDMDTPRGCPQRVLIVLQRRKARQAAQREIYFCDVALRAEILDPARERRIKLRGVDKMKKSALWIDARNDRVRRDLFSAFEHKARDSAVLNANPFDFGIGSNLRACLFRTISKRAREGAQASSWKGGRTNGMRICRGAQEEDSGRPR